MTTPMTIGRNDACHCGSGKKYKKCHQDEDARTAAEALAQERAEAAKNAPASAPGGIDPSQFSPEMIQQFTQMMQRLPKGQMQKFQSLMQRAMAGKDVSKEADGFEKTLPVEMQQWAQTFSSQYGDVIEKAQTQAAPSVATEASSEKGKMSKLWGSLFKK